MPAGAPPRVACWRASSSCRTREGYLLQLSRDLVPVVLKRLSMFILRSKVKLTDASSRWTQYGVWDPESGAPLAVSERDGAISIGIDAAGAWCSRPKGSFPPTRPRATGCWPKSAPAAR